MLSFLQQDLAWVLGYHSSCRLWLDNWTLAGPLIDKGPIPYDLLYTKNVIVGSFDENNKTVLPNRLSQDIEEQGLDIAELTVSLAHEDDALIWMKSQTGVLTIREAYVGYRKKKHEKNLAKKLWWKYIPPGISVFAWKIIMDMLPTEDNALISGIKIDGGCVVCGNQLVLEDQDHLFLHCDYMKAV